MAKQESTTTKAQREQQKLLAEAMKRPGVAAAAETYRSVQVHAAAVSTSATARTGYATGGNIA
jgi:hypothetical protein